MIGEETIAAISTPVGFGGISIIRISGEEAFKVCEKIFMRPKGKSFSEAANFSVSYGHIVNESGEILDEVLLTKMCAPHTYTTEDVAEINCHGGMSAAKSVLDLLFHFGIRMAEPGEFTKRAYLGGRIDLSQAEAVGDIITSRTETFSKVAAGQLSGKLGEKINEIKQKLLSVLSKLEVSIQYPEYDIDELTDFELNEALCEIENDITSLAKTYKKGEIVKDGLKTAIVGRPNVGKSMLLNLLINEEKAIVTDIPGTTRDVIDELIYLGGVAVKLMDTAGIRQSEDEVEAIGIKRSLAAMEAADLVLFVADASAPICEEDISIYESVKQKPHVVILNKCDIGLSEETLHFFENEDTVIMSAKQGENLDALEKFISDFAKSEPGDTLSCLLIVNARHKTLIDNAAESIRSAVATIASDMPTDLAEIDIKQCRDYLGMITGETADEDIINEIFANFCLGK